MQRSKRNREEQLAKDKVRWRLYEDNRRLVELSPVLTAMGIPSDEHKQTIDLYNRILETRSRLRRQCKAIK